MTTYVYTLSLTAAARYRPLHQSVKLFQMVDSGKVEYLLTISNTQQSFLNNWALVLQSRQTMLPPLGKDHQMVMQYMPSNYHCLLIVVIIILSKFHSKVRDSLSDALYRHGLVVHKPVVLGIHTCSVYHGTGVRYQTTHGAACTRV